MNTNNKTATAKLPGGAPLVIAGSQKAGPLPTPVKKVVTIPPKISEADAQTPAPKPAPKQVAKPAPKAGKKPHTAPEVKQEHETKHEEGAFEGKKWNKLSKNFVYCKCPHCDGVIQLGKFSATIPTDGKPTKSAHAGKKNGYSSFSGFMNEKAGKAAKDDPTIPVVTMTSYNKSQVSPIWKSLSNEVKAMWSDYADRYNADPTGEHLITEDMIPKEYPLVFVTLPNHIKGKDGNKDDHLAISVVEDDASQFDQVTVDSLAAKIRGFMYVADDYDLSLSFAGQPLDDGSKTLGDYNITPGSVIDMPEIVNAPKSRSASAKASA